MDSYEATKVVYSRIEEIDGENASKIMGYVFIQDPCEKEMLRLACAPNNVLHSIVNQAKIHLGLVPTTTTNLYHNNNYSIQVPDQLDLMDPIMSPNGCSDSMIFPSSGASSNFHRRSFSVNDVYANEEGGGFGWRPCMYYARGFCKNGENCKFLHGGGHFGDLADSPNVSMDGFDEMLRLKAMQQQQQRLAQIMAAGGASSFPYNKGIAFMNDSPRSAAAALMMADDFPKFGRLRSERGDFSAMGLVGADSTARQIYLTFPADSTFKEEDVSNYFSKFGPVQDVRIPYQQKRMFGFVTFVYPETVKMILAKGNPHFVCDSRVLVKPYKEKGKIVEKRHHHHQFERADFAACLSPTSLDAPDSFDLPIGIGPRMLLNNQEMLRRKLEQAEFQQALELQGRRLRNLQLMDLNNHQHPHLAHQFLPPGGSILSPVRAHPNHSFLLLPENSNIDISEDANNSLTEAGSSNAAADGKHVELHELNDFCNNSNADANENSEDFYNPKIDDLHESFEHILPDNLFASPKKPAGENGSMFSSALSEADDNAATSASTTITSSPLNIVSQQSCFYNHLPRFASGEEAVEM